MTVNWILPERFTYDNHAITWARLVRGAIEPSSCTFNIDRAGAPTPSRI